MGNNIKRDISKLENNIKQTMENATSIVVTQNSTVNNQIQSQTSNISNYNFSGNCSFVGNTIEQSASNISQIMNNVDQQTQMAIVNKILSEMNTKITQAKEDQKNEFTELINNIAKQLSPKGNQEIRENEIKNSILLNLKSKIDATVTVNNVTNNLSRTQIENILNLNCTDYAKVEKNKIVQTITSSVLISNITKQVQDIVSKSITESLTETELEQYQKTKDSALAGFFETYKILIIVGGVIAAIVVFVIILLIIFLLLRK